MPSSTSRVSDSTRRGARRLASSALHSCRSTMRRQRIRPPAECLGPWFAGGEPEPAPAPRYWYSPLRGREVMPVVAQADLADRAEGAISDHGRRHPISGTRRDRGFLGVRQDARPTAAASPVAGPRDGHHLARLHPRPGRVRLPDRRLLAGDQPLLLHGVPSASRRRRGRRRGWAVTSAWSTRRCRWSASAGPTNGCR